MEGERLNQLSPYLYFDQQMNHPIADNHHLQILYGSFWSLLALMQGMFLYTFYHTTPWLAAADGCMYMLFYAVVGLALWYAVRYNQVEHNKVGNLIVTHLITAAVTLTVVLLTGYYLLKIIPPIGRDYHDLFFETLPWRVLTGLFIYMVLILVYYLYVYYNNFMEKITAEADLKFNARTAELNALKNQINPHFLFNSLNSISALTLESPDKAREMIARLSDFLRFSVSEKAGEMRDFHEEIENMLRYLEIEKVRHGDRLQVIRDISSNCEGAELPSLILQPVIENAVKFGLQDALGQVMIKITAECFHGFLKVQVENSFSKDQNSKKKGAGIGLQNIAERLKLTYGRDDLLVVKDENGKFVVTLSFPQKVKNGKSPDHR